MITNSIQESLAKPEPVNEQNMIIEESKGNRKYGNRDVCNNVANWRKLSVAALYKPDQNYFLPTIIGCFIISDDWDEQVLFYVE